MCLYVNSSDVCRQTDHLASKIPPRRAEQFGQLLPHWTKHANLHSRGSSRRVEEQAILFFPEDYPMGSLPVMVRSRSASLFSPIGTPRTMFILGNVAGVFGASGDGYLCEAHFHVIGSACNTSALDVAEEKLFDTSGTGAQIPADWIHGSTLILSRASLEGNTVACCDCKRFRRCDGGSFVAGTGLAFGLSTDSSACGTTSACPQTTEEALVK